MHHHSTLEITLIASGKLSYQIGTERIDLIPGDVFFIPAGIDHRWLSPENMTIPIGFQLEIFPDNRSHSLLQRKILAIASQCHYHIREFTDFSRAVSTICDYFYSGQRDFQFIRLLLSEAIIAVLKRFPDVMLPGELSGQTEVEARIRLIQEVKAQIEKNISKPINMSFLADLFGLSERHLNRLFQTIENTSVGQYVTDRRIQHACKMLMDRNVMVKEVAIETGFCDLNYFCKVFRKKIGMAPGLYRQSIGLQNFRTIESPLSPAEKNYLGPIADNDSKSRF